MAAVLDAQTAGTDAGTRPQAADAFVAFGITGDLAKVMTFRSLYRLERRGLLNCPVLGVSVDDWSVDHLREHARACIEGTGESVDDTVFDRFAASFDNNLKNLGYRAPELAATALRSHVGEQATLDILDAGCGTGLCGPLLRPLCRRLTGVDMIDADAIAIAIGAD